MISLEQLENEVAALEAMPPTHATMQKLCSLYIVRDNLKDKKKNFEMRGTFPNADENASEFLRRLSGKTIADVLPVLDELMNALQMMNPRLYSCVIDRL